MEIKLWDHQQRAIDMARDRNNLALFMDAGTGKSRTTIEILREKFNTHKKIFKTLIICPIIVCDNWKREWLRFSGVPESQIVVLTGSGKQRITLFEKARARHKDQIIVITNYEALVSVNEVFGSLYDWGPEVVVADESHRLKNPASKRTNAAIKICDNARFKYILSGTPILNTPMDIFCQFRCLDSGRTFGKNFFAFRATYFWDKNAGMPRDKYFPQWVPKVGINEELNSLIYQSAVRAVKSECLDLPPLVKQKIYVGMSQVQARLYEEMENDFITFLNDKACTAELAITKMLRLLQILSGIFAVEKGVSELLPVTPREQALTELLEDLAPNHKVIVWCVFQGNYAVVRRVCEKLKIRYVEGHGQVGIKEKNENIDAFDKDPGVRVMIGNPKALGIGVNMIASSYSIYFSRSHSLEDDQQSEARNYRGGSEIHEKVTRIDLITKDTIDEKVMNVLENKLNVAEEILKWKRTLKFA